jgi:hypothetical protein
MDRPVAGPWDVEPVALDDWVSVSVLEQADSIDLSTANELFPSLADRTVDLDDPSIDETDSNKMKKVTPATLGAAAVVCVGVGLTLRAALR